MVINYSSRQVDINAKNHDGVTPLHMAALSNSESCTMFLKYEVDVNSVDVISPICSQEWLLQSLPTAF